MPASTTFSPATGLDPQARRLSTLSLCRCRRSWAKRISGDGFETVLRWYEQAMIADAPPVPGPDAAVCASDCGKCRS